GVHRVAVQVQAFVEQLLAHARLAVLRRERAATFLGGAGVEGRGQKAEQVGNRLRLENYRVRRGLDRLRVLRTDRLADRLFRDVLCIQSGEIEVVAGVIPRSGSVGAACRDAEAGVAGAEVAPVPVRGRRG